MQELYLTNEAGENFLTTMKELRDRVVNLDACLDPDGRFKVRGIYLPLRARYIRYSIYSLRSAIPSL